MTTTTTSTPTAPPPLMTEDQVRAWFDTNLPADDFAGKRVLLIVPDSTRTAPLPLLWDCIFQKLRPHVTQLDVMIALGTHRPMSEQEICSLLGIDPEERDKLFGQTQLLNHEWDNDEALTEIGVLSKAEVEEITEGRLSLDVPVRINKAIENYDTLLVLGPVFPHEVVGFSGGNKYFFPGISGPEVLNFFHWLGALITNVGIIGTMSTPVRDVVNKAAALIPNERKALTFVVGTGGTVDLHGLFYGSPEDAWREAAEVSNLTHIIRKDRPFQRVIACVPEMYDELWVAGKGMYKLEPVVADGGELIIYAPHLDEVSVTHGHLIREIGYHCRDYFVKQWDQFKDYPWGTLAHSTHVRGGGTFEDGIENCRVKVTIASQLTREQCEEINLGWADWESIDLAAEEADDDVLVVKKAGEQLYRLAE